MADQLKKIEGQGHEHLCHTGMPVRNGNQLALTEIQQQRLQVCENNWVRQIARVTRADRRRMAELREETGVQRSLTERLVRSRLQWAGHVERMADDRLPKRAPELREKREANAEMGGLCKERYEEHRREGRHEEEDRRQRRVGNTSR